MEIAYADKPLIRGLTAHGFALRGLTGSFWYEWLLENYRAEYANQAYDGFNGLGYGPGSAGALQIENRTGAVRYLAVTSASSM